MNHSDIMLMESISAAVISIMLMFWVYDISKGKEQEWIQHTS
mgnify:FL=1